MMLLPEAIQEGQVRAVFFGMLGVTLFGLIFTPIFYVIVRNLADGRGKKQPVAARVSVVIPGSRVARPGMTGAQLPILLADPKWMGRYGVID